MKRSQAAHEKKKRPEWRLKMTGQPVTEVQLAPGLASARAVAVLAHSGAAKHFQHADAKPLCWQAAFEQESRLKRKKQEREPKRSRA